MNKTLADLLHGKATMPFPTVVLSGRFDTLLPRLSEANLRKTLAGKMVLTIGCDTKADP